MNNIEISLKELFYIALAMNIMSDLIKNVQYSARTVFVKCTANTTKALENHHKFTGDESNAFINQIYTTFDGLSQQPFLWIHEMGKISTFSINSTQIHYTISDIIILI